MKKWTTIVLMGSILLALAACATSETNDPTQKPTLVTESFPAETTRPAETMEGSQESTVATEQTEVTELPETEVIYSLTDPIRVLYCSYTEYPYFAMLGTCNEGATVTAQIGEETYSSRSYHGWFSLRLPSEYGTADVTLTQTVNGEIFGEPIEYTAWPVTPGEGRWPVVTGGNYQFFLQSALPDYQKTNVDPDEVYSGFETILESRLETMHEYNPDAEIIYLIVPSAMTVYPELVPEDYERNEGESRLDKITTAIRNAGGTAIDLRPIFNAHKSDDMPLYRKLDSHWSEYGAYLAYQALFDHISGKYPQAAPRGANEFNWNPGYYNGGDIAYYLAMPQSEVREYACYRSFTFDASEEITSIPRYTSSESLFYNDAMTPDIVINTDRPELPSCMVIRDSYSTQIFDILAERMDRTHYLGMWNYTWYNSAVKAEKPDYVIYVVAEWNINYLLK